MPPARRVDRDRSRLAPSDSGGLRRLVVRPDRTML